MQYYKLTKTGKTYQLDKATGIAKSISSIPTGGATISWGGKNLPSELQAGLPKATPTKTPTPTTPIYKAPTYTSPTKPTIKPIPQNLIDMARSNIQSGMFSPEQAMSAMQGMITAGGYSAPTGGVEKALFGQALGDIKMKGGATGEFAPYTKGIPQMITTKRPTQFTQVTAGGVQRQATALSPDQIKEYYATEAKKARPLSPMDWLAKQTTTPTATRQKAIDYLKSMGYASPDEGEIQGAMRELSAGAPTAPPAPILPPPAEKDTAQSEEQQRQAELNQINETERAEAEKELGIIEQEATGEVDVSKSAKLIASLYEAEVEQPEAPSLVEQFQTERQRLGIEPLETELADVDSQIEEIQSNLVIEAEKAGERLVPMGQITRRRGKLQTEADQRIQRLQIERNSLARRLDNKMETLNTIMSLTNQDFQNASAIYDKEFNKSLQLINLLQGEESQDMKEAQSNLNTIINLAQDSNKTFSEMTPSIQRQIRNLEIQQGLPAGTTETFLNEKPKAKVLSTSKGTDEAGNEITTFIFENPETGMPGVVEVIGTGGVDVKTTEDDDRKQEFDDAVDFVKANKDKTRAELKLVLQRDSDLNNSEINNILDAENIQKEVAETPISDALLDSYAEQFADTVKKFFTGREKEFENAKLLIERNAKKQKWSPTQVETITQKVKDILKIK